MTTAFVVHPLHGPTSVPGQRFLVIRTSTARARGRDAVKLREVTRTFERGTARGHSAESAQLVAALQAVQFDLAANLDDLQSLVQSRPEDSYEHIPTRPAFTVRAKFKFIGKLKPRRFPLVE
jgi:hypothetical protein